MLSGHASQTTPIKEGGGGGREGEGGKSECMTQWLRALDSVPSTYMAANNYL